MHTIFVVTIFQEIKMQLGKHLKICVFESRCGAQNGMKEPTSVLAKPG